MTRTRIAPQSGVSLELRAGSCLRVIDPQGEQVADLVAYNGADANEWISSGRTFDYNNTIYLTTGHILYSNRSRPLLTIVEDAVGRHDFLYTPCSPETFTHIYKITAHHPSCFENLSRSLEPYGITPDRIPTTFNIFMNVSVLPDGELKIDPPRSQPGDFIVLRAEMDLIVGLTACRRRCRTTTRSSRLISKSQCDHGGTQRPLRPRRPQWFLAFVDPEKRCVCELGGLRVPSFVP